jgi:hypothetical protein
LIIDFHTHIFSPRFRQYRSDYVGRDPCFAELYSSHKAKMATADELVAAMDEAGVDDSVVLNIGWLNVELCHAANDYLLESAARFPKRLIAFCGVQPLARATAIAELERCVRGGALGIGELRPDMQGFDLSDRKVTEPLVEAAIEHRLILLTHSSEPLGHSYPGKGAVTPPMLYRFATGFPKVRLVCAHWGGGLPFYALMPEVRQGLANVWFDTAATPYLYEPAIYAAAAGIIGEGRILFGSDFPLMSQRRVMDQIEGSGLSPEGKRQVMGENAAALLGLV